MRVLHSLHQQHDDNDVVTMMMVMMMMMTMTIQTKSLLLSPSIATKSDGGSGKSF